MPKKSAPTVVADKHEEVPAVIGNSRASVYYEKSLTKNLGNYESAKITVGLTLPIDITEKERARVEAVIEMADEIVTEELEIQVKELLDDK